MDDSVVVLFPKKHRSSPANPQIVSEMMIKAAFQEAAKYGYDLTNNPDIMLDFEAIFKLINASVSRHAELEDPFQNVLDKLTGSNQGSNHDDI